MLLALPKTDITIRAATMSDIPFIDGLQKQYSKNIGFLQTKALEGKIALDQVLIAEFVGARPASPASEVQQTGDAGVAPTNPVGYIIAQDRYFKRDELGMICQLVVAPNQQRGFIGAALLKAQFDRSAYGCRLYCCWCAQDLEANRFWESMGFVPLAYRAGSEKKQRVHIFWQKKIRGADDAVNWWFPSKTDQGAIRADRIVLPIPPGVHWRDVVPPEIPKEEPLSLPSPARGEGKKAPARVVLPKKKVTLASCGLRSAEQVKAEIQIVQTKTPKAKPPKVKLKIDPKYIAAARELRDRYLEEVNERGYRLESCGKYDVTRTIAASSDQRLLAA